MGFSQSLIPFPSAVATLVPTLALSFAQTSPASTLITDFTHICPSGRVGPIICHSSLSPTQALVPLGPYSHSGPSRTPCLASHQASWLCITSTVHNLHLSSRFFLCSCCLNWQHLEKGELPLSKHSPIHPPFFWMHSQAYNSTPYPGVDGC